MSNIKSERLVLSQFNHGDEPFLFELMNSEGWLKYISGNQSKTRAQVDLYLDSVLINAYREHGYGLNKVTLKDGTPIGMCGIVNRTNSECPDLGFALLPEFERKGYAFEMSKAILQHAREHLKLTRIDAITLPTNISSIQLLTKLGFEFVQFKENNEEQLSMYSLQLV